MRITVTFFLTLVGVNGPELHAALRMSDIIILIISCLPSENAQQMVDDRHRRSLTAQKHPQKEKRKRKLYFIISISLDFDIRVCRIVVPSLGGLGRPRTVCSYKQHIYHVSDFYISISLGFGILVCRMVVPPSVGLKGPLPPYGFGIPSSSGM